MMNIINLIVKLLINQLIEIKQYWYLITEIYIDLSESVQVMAPRFASFGTWASWLRVGLGWGSPSTSRWNLRFSAHINAGYNGLLAPKTKSAGNVNFALIRGWAVFKAWNSRAKDLQRNDPRLGTTNHGCFRVKLMFSGGTMLLMSWLGRVS